VGLLQRKDRRNAGILANHKVTPVAAAVARFDAAYFTWAQQLLDLRRKTPDRSSAELNRATLSNIPASVFNGGERLKTIETYVTEVVT
jgi:hypothetical protein